MKGKAQGAVSGGNLGFFVGLAVDPLPPATLMMGYYFYLT